MLENKVEAEKIFFKYAYHCTQNLLDRGKITENEFKKMTSFYNLNKTPPKKLLEKVYPNASRRIKRYANEIGLPPWSEKAVREYFLKNHNAVIDRGEDAYSHPKYTKDMKELCKVYIVEIKRKEKNNSHVFYDVKHGDKEFKIVGDLIPDAKIGDMVSIHYRYAIEKISED